MFYRYKPFVLFMALFAISTLSGCVSIVNEDPKQMFVKSAPSSPYKNVNTAQVNRELDEVNDEIDAFWRKARPYMHDDGKCSAKQNKQGLWFKTKSKQLCVELKQLEARQNKLIAQRDGYEQYQTAQRRNDHQRQVAQDDSEFDDSKKKTTLISTIVGTIGGAAIGYAKGGDAKSAFVGGIVGGTGGALVGTAANNAKENQYTSEKQVNQKIFDVKESIRSIKQQNESLRDSIRYYEAKRDKLIIRKRRGIASNTELEQYRLQLKTEKRKAIQDLELAEKKLAAHKATYRRQQQSGQSSNTANLQAEVAELEKEKRMFENNVNSLLAISASI